MKQNIYIVVSHDIFRTHTFSQGVGLFGCVVLLILALKRYEKDLLRYDMDRVIITIKYTKKLNLLLQLRQTCPTTE